MIAGCNDGHGPRELVNIAAGVPGLAPPQEINVFASRRWASALLPAIALAASPAFAAEFRDFDQGTFAHAQAEGRPILIDVHAWWCPVCLSQSGTIKSITTAPAYDRLLVLRVNYDKQKPVWKSFGARKQATLIGFHHGREVSRLAYMTNKDRIRALLDQTVR